MVFANHILGKSTLSEQARELVILRIGYLCQSGYEWGQHVVIARRVGMTDEEILFSKSGPETPVYQPSIACCCRRRMNSTRMLIFPTRRGQGCPSTLNPQQMMDLVFTVGQYNLVSMALNSFGVQLDEGVPDWNLNVKH